ncbi:uncharacterized protein CEXT_734071 [Caerostris extrusa]|uniref:Uncharacterized protein n=1 Tax=Caerostris extrusa TaxID=172846 RepID=A0AAV4TWW1_CAEEX|nr:uncharacterized protein CEXT_734071 [Caerostris extrusa]
MLLSYSLLLKRLKKHSICVFPVVALNLGLSFTSFAYTLGYYNVSTSATAGVVLWFISTQACFISIVWVASDVKNKSKDLKKAFQLALIELEASEQTSVLYFQKIKILDSVSLTGWKMFEFTRGLILSVAGMILSYGILILQTENYKSRRSPHLIKDLHRKNLI